MRIRAGVAEPDWRLWDPGCSIGRVTYDTSFPNGRMSGMCGVRCHAPPTGGFEKAVSTTAPTDISSNRCNCWPLSVRSLGSTAAPTTGITGGSPVKTADRWPDLVENSRPTNLMSYSVASTGSSAHFWIALIPLANTARHFRSHAFRIIRTFKASGICLCSQWN